MRICPLCHARMRVGKVWHPTNAITIRTYSCPVCRKKATANYRRIFRTQEILIDDGYDTNRKVERHD